MALSERDQMILREMELALSADTTRPAASRSSANFGTRHYLGVAIGLLIAGALALTVGLRLADELGTGLGVLGFVLIVGSAWGFIRLLRPSDDDATRGHDVREYQ